MKFKVGDKVLLNGPGAHESFKGLTGTIQEVDYPLHSGYPYLVAIDRKHTEFHTNWRLGVMTCNEECLHPIGMFKKYIKVHDIMT
jgi:hypothetical protein